MIDDVEFVNVVDQHYGPLYRFAWSLVHVEADACDLVQETFYIWMKKRDQIRDGTRTKSWLFTTLYREFLQNRRRSARFPEVEIGDVENDLPPVPEANSNKMDGHRIAAFIAQLDECFRAPLAFFYIEDLSYEEIAKVLGLPLGTVKSRLSRGVAQLRARLALDIHAGKGTANE